MYWTKKQPTEPGWYWTKKTGARGEIARIIQIRYFDGELCISNWRIPYENVIWAGPIPKPESKRRYFKDG